MRHEMLTQRALFCHRTNTKRGTLSQHFVTHAVPPLVANIQCALTTNTPELSPPSGGSGEGAPPPPLGRD